MFGRMMNNYYYGKSGKGDYRKEDLPQNRRELFSVTLKTRLSALFRINLLYMVIFLPAMVVILVHFIQWYSMTGQLALIQSNDYSAYVEMLTENSTELPMSEEDYYKARQYSHSDVFNSVLYRMLLWLVPCIAITGPFTAGLSYVTRNWARDEHAFMWTDFKDAVKANWKQSLVLSVITGILPLAAYVGWTFYGQMADRSPFMIVPQVLVVMMALIWALSITYMHPLAVTYELKMKDLLRNGLILGVARLPMSVGIRLLHCVPALICFGLMYFWDPMIGALILFGYYFLIGFGLSRFVTASYTNAVFDRFINPRIEGAKVDQGIHRQDDDDDMEEDETAKGETGD